MRTVHWNKNIPGTPSRCYPSICKNSYTSDRERGQGVLEFVVVSSSIIFFIFMYVNLCYVFLVSEYIDYSVFMSARSLFAAHQAYQGSCTLGSPAPTQECMAQLTLESMLKLDAGGVFGPLVKFKTTAQEAVQAKAHYPNPHTKDNLVAGVKVEYEVPLFIIPPLGVLKKEDISRVTRISVVSETYLDREPTQDECYNRLEQIMRSWFPSGAFGPELGSSDAFREATDDGC